MKLPKRNTAGSTLGLVAVLILVIIAIGVFVYYGGRLISGNHQLNMASDAGILSATKQALVRPAVALNDSALPNNTGNNTGWPYNDFFALADQQINGHPAIDLLTYNRCVAQAIIVCANAAIIKTDAANSHACQVAEAVRCLGNRMQEVFQQGKLDQYYLDQANANNMNMLGGKTPEISLNPTYPHLQPCYAGIASQFNSNVWFDPSIFYDNENVKYTNGSYVYGGDGGYTIPLVTRKNSAEPNTSVDPNFPADAQKKYLAGYAPIIVLRDLGLDVGNTQATGNASEILHMVPNLPQQTTHLIDVDRASTTPPDNLTPPNAFKATARSNASVLNNSASRSAPPDNTGGGGGGGNGPTAGPGAGGSSSNLYVNAVSCAIVGCGDKDYVACIPAGFIRFVNGPDMNVLAPCGTVTAVSYDASSFVSNTYALSPTNFLYVATPLPIAPDGNVDQTKVIFGTTAAAKAFITIQSRFNSSHSVNFQDVVNGNQRAITLDPLAAVEIEAPNGAGGTVKIQKPTMWWLGQDPDAPGKGNPDLTVPSLHEGTGLNHLTCLRNIQFMTGLMTLTDMSFDGTSSVDGYSAQNVAQVLDAVSNNLGCGITEALPPGDNGSPVPAPGESRWTAPEYYKQQILSTFKRDYVVGHASFVYKPVKSGMEFFWWFNPNTGDREYVASPNNYYHRLQPGSAAAKMEIPQSCKFQWAAPPWDYIFLLDQVIQRKGGYNAGQTTFNQFVSTVLQAARQINPAYTFNDVAVAMGTHPNGQPFDPSKVLYPGQTLWMYADPNTGALVMNGKKPPQDTDIIPDGANSGSGAKLELQPDQYLLLSGIIINTTKRGTPKCMTADCNVEEEPWRVDSKQVWLGMGAWFTTSCGFNNLLGCVTFYENVGGKGTSSLEQETVNYSNAN